MRDLKYNKERLLEFLKDLDDVLLEEKIEQPIDIIAIGGSAMNLLGLRGDTKDIDFFYRGLGYDEFSRIVQKLYDKYNEGDIDYWEDGVMNLSGKGRLITQHLPRDYFTIAEPQPMKFKRINLKVLNPIDIILTKINRADIKDVDDIRKLVSTFNVQKTDLIERFKTYYKNYEGNEEILQKQFNMVLKEVYEHYSKSL